MDFEIKDRYGIDDLLYIVKILRAPGGCPWDREQTHQSIRTNLIEETYEVADAIDRQDDALLREELGDLLLQIVLHTEMEDEAERFNFEDVCDGICKKLVYRHPHVFGEVQADNTEQVLKNWETLKNAEKGRSTAAARLDSVPPALPALMRSEKIQKRAAEFGFCYKDINGAVADLDAEIAELKQALAEGRGAPEELGDVLFAAVNVARFIPTDAEEALDKSCNRFTNRVKTVEQMAQLKGLEIRDLDAAEMDDLWREAKRRLALEDE